MSRRGVGGAVATAALLAGTRLGLRVVGLLAMGWIVAQAIAGGDSSAEVASQNLVVVSEPDLAGLGWAGRDAAGPGAPR